MSHTMVVVTAVATGLGVLCEVRTEVEETIEHQAYDNSVRQPYVSTPSTEAEEKIESLCCV
jgi:hypothetical protein